MAKTVLVVDDNSDNRYLLKSLLEGHGYEVIEAADGLQAFERSEKHLPNVVVTDLLMPGMDGFSFCRKWTGDEKTSQIPIVVYTATYTDPKDRQLALDSGASAFILKPAEPEELLRTVVSTLSDSPTAHSGTRIAENCDFFERYSLRLQEKLSHKLDRLSVADKNLAEYIVRCEAILDATSNAVISVDPEHRIMTWNIRAEELLEYTEEEVLNLPLETIFPADTSKELFEKLEAVSFGTRSMRFETKKLNKKGDELDLEVSLSSLGPNIGYMVVVSDLTALKKAAEDKKRLEEQLEAAQRLESVGRLAGGVAHDFNNLLTVILYHAESIENDGKPDGLFQGEAKHIREAGERAVSLTRQLLAFSRQQTIKKSVIDLNSTVNSMGAMLKRLIGEDIELKLELSDELSNIEADRSQIEQVILNLAVNARDAMPNGGRLILRTENRIMDEESVAMYPTMKEGPFVMLAVTDNGEGMDEETLTHIFDPFFTTKPSGKGTGLGLATVWGVVQQNDGFISTYSEKGFGTTFKVFLPESNSERKPVSAPPQFLDIKGRGETILVVEDDEMVRRIATQILTRAGYSALEASNANQALSLAEQSTTQIHLLMTDVIMPGMNGRDLAKRLLTHRPSMKVVFISGYTDDAIARHGILDSGISLLEKPFSYQSLTTIIRAVLDNIKPGGIGD